MLGCLFRAVNFRYPPRFSLGWGSVCDWHMILDLDEMQL